MLRNCSPQRYAVNKERMLRLAEYSRDCLAQLRAETGLRYEGREGGTLQVFRTQAQLDGVDKDVAVLGRRRSLRAAGGRRRCCAPSRRSPAGRLAGGLRLPSDETGDCHLFTASGPPGSAMGVRFVFGAPIDRVEVCGGRIAGVRRGSSCSRPMPT